MSAGAPAHEGPPVTDKAVDGRVAGTSLPADFLQVGAVESSSKKPDDVARVHIGEMKNLADEKKSGKEDGSSSSTNTGMKLETSDAATVAGRDDVRPAGKTTKKDLVEKDRDAIVTELAAAQTSTDKRAPSTTVEASSHGETEKSVEKASSTATSIGGDGNMSTTSRARTGAAPDREAGSVADRGEKSPRDVSTTLRSYDQGSGSEDAHTQQNGLRPIVDKQSGKLVGATSRQAGDDTAQSRSKIKVANSERDVQDESTLQMFGPNNLGANSALLGGTPRPLFGGTPDQSTRQRAAQLLATQKAREALVVQAASQRGGRTPTSILVYPGGGAQRVEERLRPKRFLDAEERAQRQRLQSAGADSLEPWETFLTELAAKADEAKGRNDDFGNFPRALVFRYYLVWLETQKTPEAEHPLLAEDARRDLLVQAAEKMTPDGGAAIETALKSVFAIGNSSEAGKKITAEDNAALENFVSQQSAAARAAASVQPSLATPTVGEETTRSAVQLEGAQEPTTSAADPVADTKSKTNFPRRSFAAIEDDRAAVSSSMVEVASKTVSGFNIGAAVDAPPAGHAKYVDEDTEEEGEKRAASSQQDSASGGVWGNEAGGDSKKQKNSGSGRDTNASSGLSPQLMGDASTPA
ncbi:unnamed protein product [Amoebophrya sp. A120]|nr:unnamed protein product [Amoebophrya sp. A120]|eukprot:GSA120T00005921001.1